MQADTKVFIKDKYARFKLPNGAAGMAAHLARHRIRQKIKELSELHIFNYKTETNGYTLNVYFEREEDITLFFLVWQPDRYAKMPELYVRQS